MAFNATFTNISVISWQSVLLVEETGVRGEKHRPGASHIQTLSHKVFCLFCLYISMSMRSCTMYTCVKGNDFANVV